MRVRQADGLSGWPVATGQACYEWSPLPFGNGSTLTVEQMLPWSVTGNIWRRWLLVLQCMELQSCGIEDAVRGYPAFRLGVGELCGLRG